jgi:hypothetical protein
MSEETQEQEGTWSGLKKTIIGVASTAVVAVGTWATSLLGGGEPAPAPAAAPVINITNSNQQSQAAGGKTVIIKEKAVGGTQPVAAPAPKPKKKEGDEFKEEAPKW